MYPFTNVLQTTESARTGYLIETDSRHVQFPLSHYSKEVSNHLKPLHECLVKGKSISNLLPSQYEFEHQRMIYNVFDPP